MAFVVDGAAVAGGGQVLRNCSAYAAILGKLVHFKNIRANRRRPGLREQYIEGLEVVASFSNSAVQGAEVGSQEVWFIPGQSPSRDSHESLPQLVHTKAAATSLLLQAALPVLLFSASAKDVLFTGGSSMFISPSIDYMKYVFAPLLQKILKVSVDIDIVRRDFMPKGNALVRIRTNPSEKLQKICLKERGTIVRVSSILYGYGKADQQFIDAVRNALSKALKLHGLGMDVGFTDDIQGMEDEVDLVCQLLIYVETSTGCILGASSRSGDHHDLVKPEELTYTAVSALVKQLECGGCTDNYLQDQLIIFMALADGVSEIVTGPITDHTKHALHYAQIMTDAKFDVIPEDGGKNLIRCVGVGHSTRNHKTIQLEIPSRSGLKIGGGERTSESLASPTSVLGFAV